MNKQYLFGLLLIVLLTAPVDCASEKEQPYTGPPQNDVIQLTADNLQSLVFESDEAWLIDLYAYWCDHCKKLRPQWAKLATKLKGVANVAKIDASQNRQFDQLFGLKGYPHVVMVPPGPKDKKIYYVHEGARTASSLEEWALEKMKASKGFLVERLTSDAVWKQYCVDLSIPLCIVVFLPSLIDSTTTERAVYLETLRSVVNNFRDKPVSFLWAQAGDHQGIQDQFAMYSGFPAVILINPIRRVFSIMNSAFTEENFQDWLKDILNRKGGRRFKQYSKQLEWNTIQAQKEPQVQASDIKIDQQVVEL